MEHWIFPLTILPGIGLIITSTTAISNSLIAEINHLLGEDNCRKQLLERKIAQLSLLNWALVALYLSAAFCALGGFMGAILMKGSPESQMYVSWIAGFGVGVLLLASILLIIYGMRAVRIKRHQFLDRLNY